MNDDDDNIEIKTIDWFLFISFFLDTVFRFIKKKKKYINRAKSFIIEWNMCRHDMVEIDVQENFQFANCRVCK